MTDSISIQNLTHRYGKQMVLNNISLTVPKGSIYGFLGANGSGKTTTLSLVLGLNKKQFGEIIILGKNFEANRIEVLKKVGSLIEYPSVYGHLSALENLLVWQKIHKCPKERINEVLSLVGLSEAGNKKTKNFSLGMKQRLGLAIALLNKPALLVLDEPTNGLDPNGIIEMRELLVRLNNEFGITIFISSHLLSEIEKIVTHIGILHQGSILFEGTIDELKNKNNSTKTITLSCNNIDNAFKILNEKYSTKCVDEKIEITVQNNSDIAAILRMLIQNNIEIYEVVQSKPELETIFMDVIK
ncbi:MAG: ATP-binding cassette domain-containing protein [Gammaproteobacteria bacterium]|nr:ATP-binding cassette domain-containing protein [Gammaproteobacteria bacterium]